MFSRATSYTQATLLSMVAVVLIAAPGLAQPASSSDASVPQSEAVVEDIIVTARKRDETSLQSPVVLTGVGAPEIRRRSITNVDAVARVVPQLVVGPDTGTQGGTISLRGISGPNQNTFGEQAVAFNIDGVPISKSAVRRMGETDIQQIEVLKGPQALFYGKNSPGGIITIRTADPTPSLEAKASVGYEFYAREKRVEGYVSGPVTSTLGVRVAGYFSDSDGAVKNELPANAFLASSVPDRLPGGRDYAARLTLKWEPSEKFNLRLKGTYGRVQDTGATGRLQKIGCTFGTPQTGALSDCTADDRTSNGAPGPLVVGAGKYFRNGENYTDQDQQLASLEMNYQLSDHIELSSVTGFYRFGLSLAGNYSTDYALDLASAQRLTNREVSQEFRIRTNYDGPVNFMAGGFISDTHQYSYGNTFLYAAEQSAVPLLIAAGRPGLLRSLNIVSAVELMQDGRAYSGFGQMSFKPIPTFEITAGARYSYEHKELPLVKSGLGRTVNLDNSTIVQPPVSRKRWTDVSPEVTLSYRPTSELNFFASYKEGFLSGGFNAQAGSFTAGDISYDPETIKGFEAGAKALLLDNRLRLNFAAYTYRANGIQVANTVNAVQFIRNAAAVRIRGFEGDLNYATPIEGLSLTGAVSYNQGNYISFPNAPCYTGQTPAQGCTLNPVSRGNEQNLSGRPLIQTPKWAGNIGFNYEHPLGSTKKIGLSSNVSYSGSYFADAFEDPRGKMPQYALVDASFRLAQADDRWELALIGRNLTDRRYWTTALDISFTGRGTGTAGGIRSDKEAALSRGRELMLRYTMMFGR